MSGFDALLKGLAQFDKGMKQFSTNRAINQAQEQMQQINTMETDEMKKRQQLNSVAQDLTFNLTKAGADPTQVAQTAGMVRPVAITTPDEAFMQGQLTGNKLFGTIAQNAQDFKSAPDLKKQALELASKERIAEGQVDALTGKKVDDKFTKFSQELDPNRARTGNLGNLQAKINQTDRLKALVGTGMNLDSRQQEELAIGLQNLLSNGNVAAVSQVEALIPHTAMANSQKMREFLYNSPQGLNNQEFVKKMLDTVDREKTVIGGQLKKAQYQKVNGFAELASKDPARYQQILQSYDLNADEHQHFMKTRELKPAPQAPGQEQKVRIKAPTGKVILVPESQVEAALRAGGQRG